MNAETKDIWSRPVQASIRVPLDTFKVEADDRIPGVQIRLDGDKVYVSVMGHDHVSCLKSKTIPYTEFAATFGKVFFGPDWRNS